MAYYKCGKIFATQNSNTSIETASGAIANFNTSLAMPVLDCNAEFSATQDLHGQSAPYPAGGGKNIAYFEDDISEQSQHLSVSYSGYNDLSFEVLGTYARIIYGIPCEVGVQYTASFKGYCTADYKRVQFRSSNVWGPSDYGQVTVTGTEASYNLTFTATTGTIFVAFYLSSQNSTSGKAEIKDFMIEKGGSATSFAPYENICPIVGVDKVNITRTGKNIITGSISGKNISSSGLVINDSSYNLIYAPVKQGQKYVITSDNNLWAFYTDIPAPNSQSYDSSRVLDSSKKFTAPITGYVAFRTTSGYSTPQLEFGETATEYEAPTVVTALINLGGTYFGGYIDVVTGKITLTAKKLTITNQSDIKIASNENGFLFYVSTGESLIKNDKQFNNMGLTYYQQASSLYSRENGFVFYANGTFYFKFDNATNTVDLAKAILANNPLEGWAEIATPIVVYASNTAEILTKAGLNNIFCDTGNIEVKYRRIAQ